MHVTLPTELWIRILSLIANDSNDRPKLWVSGRAVCTAFKEAIETIFREKHLPKTFIAYHLGTHFLDSDSDDSDDDSTPREVVISLDFNFSHLSADKTIAFFVDEHVHPKFKPLVTSELLLALSMKQFERPSHTVQVRREMNDTPIPGVSVDCDTMMLNCDWRGLYSAFFAEEVIVNKIRDREMESFDARRTALIDNVRGGRVDMVVAIQQMLMQYGNTTDEARKQARRVRIRRQYEKEGYSGWRPCEEEEEEEDRIHKVLKERIFFASAQSFSDEEGGDDEEAEDEDDEWEDEDGEEEDYGEEDDGEEDGADEEIEAGLGNE